MKFEPFSIPLPEASNASAHTRAMLESGALLVPARVFNFALSPGSAILCPRCYNAFDLDPVWTDSEISVGYSCSCGHCFANCDAVHLVFGHLAK